MDDSALLRLIKSLSSSEKRYFKVSSNAFSGNKNLLYVFDLLDGNKYSDQEELVQAIADAGIKGKWSLLQNRLYALILKSLRQYHAKANIDNQLQHLLLDVDVLYRKKLFDDCLKAIRKARKLALAHERHLALLHLLHWETMLQKEKGKHLNQDRNELKKMHDQESLLLQQYQRYTHYKFHVFNYLLMSRNRMLPENDREMKRYDEVLASQPFSAPDDDVTLQERCFRLSLSGMYHFNTGNLLESRKCFIQLCEVIETSERGTEHMLTEYFMGLNNLMIPQGLVRDFKGFEQTVEKLYAHFTPHKSFHKELFSTTTCYEFGIYHEVGAFDKLEEMLPQVLEGLEKYGKILNPINSYIFYFNVALTYFYRKDYSSAIRWINRLLNDHDKRPSPQTGNLYYFGHFLSLVLHYEAGHIEWLRHQAPSVINLLNGVRPLNDYEYLILNKFKNELGEAMSKSEQLAFMRSWLDELKAYKGPATDKGVLRFFRFEKWLRSHLTERPMVELIRNEAIENAFE